jgi:fructan beta-fructosidase
LVATPAGLRLLQNPASVITDSLDHKKPLVNFHGVVADRSPSLVTRAGITVPALDLSAQAHLAANAYWLDATLDMSKATSVYVDLAYVPGAAPAAKYVRVGYDTARHELFVDCSASEAANKSPENLMLRTPLDMQNGKLRLRILLDRSSLEVFGGMGEKVISTMIYPDKGAIGLSMKVVGQVKVEKLKLWGL